MSTESLPVEPGAGTTLLDAHDAVLFDLDGTVYRGAEPVTGAVPTIERVRRGGVAVRYVTNNASKPAESVADTLREMGFEADPSEVSTSAQAGAALLAERLRPGDPVLVVGAPALADEVAARGLVVVSAEAEEPAAVVQGHSPHTTWADLAEACLAVRRGCLWVACNRDSTLPTERGELPGNGAMVAALEEATGRRPLVAGKPERPLLDRAVRSAGSRNPLMVGDRLETDIAGAVTTGMRSLAVLTGTSTPAGLLSAPAGQRCDHLAADLSALHRPPEESLVTERPDWKVRPEGAELALSWLGTGEPDSVDALRALCAAWWPAGTGRVAVRGDDRTADEALRRLDLADPSA